MTIIRHELKQNRLSLSVWTGVIVFMLAICVFMFPEMKGEMEGVGEIFASMGSFTEAFGMDRINFGTFKGFYAVECGNVLGIGGALFASLFGISALSKEEKEHTAEFLLTHPISRIRVVTEKLIAVIIQVLILNVVALIVSLASAMIIGEEIPWKEFFLLHFAYLLLQIELASVCFGISAFLSHGGIGIGLGLGISMYFLNLIANISDSASFLKYITPFGYTEGADILSGGTLDIKLILLGMIYSLIGIFTAYFWYCKKDIK